MDYDIGMEVIRQKSWIEADYYEDPMDFNDASMELLDTVKLTKYSTNITLTNKGKITSLHINEIAVEKGNDGSDEE